MALINQAELLSKKYSAVVTNPPYMNKFEKNLKDFAKKYYKDYSKDLFSMFIYRNFDFCNEYGYNALMTPLVWMFLQVYEKLRNYIINNKNISSLIQLEYSAFSEATVPICTFVLINNNIKYNGTYLKLSEFLGGMNTQKEKVLESINKTVNFKFISNIQNFRKIPGTPIAYWVSRNIINCFDNNNLKSTSTAISGMTTGNNNLYLKLWYEVDFNKISINNSNMKFIDLKKKYWIPYNKGGERRNWYGNNDYIINWSLNEELHRAKTTCSHLYLKEGITASMITSSKFSARFFDKGFLWDRAGSPIFFNDYEKLYYCLGILCTNFTDYILKIINPTLSMSSGDLEKIPFIFDKAKKDKIIKLVKDNIKITKEDWDEFENSWDFKSHPYILFKISNVLKDTHLNYEFYKKEEFNKLKQNEIELNKIFNEIYSLNLNPKIEDKYISVTLTDYKSNIKSFISYAIGCMFGRYSLDQEGLQFAGGNFDLNIYHRFIPDDDNIIPVLDTAYFDDDIVGYFTKFVETCFGKETLEENLDFIARALSKSKKPSREIIRQYLLKNFFNDHKRTYKKCPIYWQFSSGKHNGFNCLVYMHRYEPSLVARIRTDYLHKTQKAIEQRIVNNDNIINNSTSKQEVANATKEKAKLQKQLKETQEYDEVLAHIANQNIKIDLDDGVKVNYAKFQNIEIKKEGSKTKKVNLLKKI